MNGMRLLNVKLKQRTYLTVHCETRCESITIELRSGSETALVTVQVNENKNKTQ